MNYPRICISPKFWREHDKHIIVINLKVSRTELGLLSIFLYLKDFCFCWCILIHKYRIHAGEFTLNFVASVINVAYTRWSIYCLTDYPSFLSQNLETYFKVLMTTFCD